MARLVEVDAIPGAKPSAELTAKTSRSPDEVAAYNEGRDSSWRGLMNVLQGPTLGFADEIGGGLSALVKTPFNDKSLAQNYRESRDFIRGGSDQAAKDNPIFSSVTQAMASAPMMLVNPGAKLFGGASGMLANSGRAAVTGGAFGTAQGAGTSTADDLSGVVKDAATQGVTSAVLGAASTPVLAGMGSMGRNVQQRFSESSALQYAKQKVAEALARDKTTPQRVSARMTTLGDEAAAADAAGQNTRQLLDTLATLPGETKNTVETMIRNRQAGRADRLIGSAESAMGVGGVRLAPQLDDWVTQRAAQAEPLYERVRQIVVRPDQQLVGLVNAAEQLGAGRIAQDIATARRMPYSLDVNNPQSFAMRDLDHLKQGLDQLISSSKGTKPDGSMTPLGNAVNDLRTQLLRKLDSMTGGPQGVYASARNAFAGPSALMDAASAGRMALTRDDATITSMMSGLSQSERDAFALGAFEALRAKLGARAGQTQMMELWREKGLQEKLKAIFGDERAYREFAADLAKERTLKQLEGVGRGSQTAARLMGAGDLDSPAVKDLAGAALSAKVGDPVGVFQRLGGFWNRVQTPEPVRDAMGRILLQQGPQARTGLLQLDDVMRQVQQSRAREAGAYGITAGTLPGLLSAP